MFQLLKILKEQDEAQNFSDFGKSWVADSQIIND